jgi:nicotinamidase-related amidase
VNEGFSADPHRRSPSPLLIDRDASIVLAIDLQETFVPLVERGDRVVRATERLLRAAALFEVPRFGTEQYPEKLKPFVPELLAALPKRFEKRTFSLRDSADLVSRLESLRKDEGRTQILLTGVETHVCVLQSALDLIAWGFDVFVLEDAVSARTGFLHASGLARMRDAGAFVACTESVLFEWCRDSKDPRFKAVSAMVKEFA